MKKHFCTGLLILLIALIVPSFSLAQTKNNSLNLELGKETGYIPAFNYLNIKLLNINQPICQATPCSKTVSILVSNKSIKTEKPVIYNLNEGDSVDHNIANIKVSAISENNATFVILDAKNSNNSSNGFVETNLKDPIGESNVPISPVNGICPEDYVTNESGKECLKPSIPQKIPIAPSQGAKDVIGSSFILAPINGECPENHLISDNGKTCIKLDVKIPIATKEGEKRQTRVSSLSPTPINGECSDGMVLSENGKECLKIAPKIIIAPKEGFKEVVFGSGGKTTVRNNDTKKEATVTSEVGFDVVVSVKTEGEKQSKNITVESKANSDEINISTGKILALTKEAVEIKENKIFLNKKEIKVMPDTASKKAIEKLGNLGFKIELKDTGKGEIKEPTYEIVGTKDVKIFRLFNAKMKVSTNINAQTGEMSESNYPWWSFIAK